MAEIKTKEYAIVINGVKESIDAVESLNKSLEKLEERFKALEDKLNLNIKVNTPNIEQLEDIVTSASYDDVKKQDNSALEEADKLQRDILATEEKLAEVRDENYKKLYHMKEELKEYTAIAKAQAAREENQQGLYDTNTMFGIKGQLKSIKTEMQTLDIDSDRFRELTQQANELNNKLKEIEQSYGVFGRNVGNYANSIVEGIQNVKINVNGVDREFSSAKEASRELGNELKNMAVNGKQGTKEFKELQKAVAKLNSDLKDATVSSSAMDNLLDTMQSFASIGSIATGFSALFGFDDTEIEKSIQKLVALQNVMKGLEEIKQQMNTGEGIGGWLSKGNELIDQFAAKVTGLDKAQQALNTTNAATKASTEGLTVAQEAQTVATTTTTVATKALSMALKAIGIGLVISLVAILITYWKDIYKWFTDTIPVLKNLSTWFDKIMAVAAGVGNAVLNYVVQPFATLGKTIKALMEGNFKDIPSIITNGMKKTFNVVKNFQNGFNREVQRQQESHNEKMRASQLKANEEALKDEEAKYGKSHARTQAYLKKQLSLVKKGSQEEKDLQRRLWEDQRQQREENQRKASKDQQKYNKEVTDADKELVRLRIENMKEGLRKTITQLEEERKAKLAKIKADGVLVEQLTLETNKLYDKKVEEAHRKHGEELIKIQENVYKRLLEERIKYVQRYQSLATINEENSIVNLRNAKTEYYNQGISSYGIQGKNQYSSQTRQRLRIISEERTEIVEEYKKLIDVQREYSTSYNMFMAKELEKNEELTKAEQNRLKVKKEVNKKLEELEKQHTAMSQEEYEKRGLDILERYDEADREAKKYAENFKKLQEQADSMSESEYNRLADEYLEKATYYLEIRKKVEEEMNTLNVARKTMSDEEYETKKIEIQKLLDVEDKKIERLKETYAKESSALKEETERKLKIYDEYKAELDKKYVTEEDRILTSTTLQMLYEENYTRSLTDTFKQRLSAVDSYWQMRITNEKTNAELAYQTEKEAEELNRKKLEMEEEASWKEQLKQFDEYRTKKIEEVKVQAEEEKWTEEELNIELNNIDREYQKISEEAYKNHTDNLQVIDFEHSSKMVSIENSKNEKLKRVNAEYYQDQLQEYRDFQTALSNLESKQPVMNIWGIVNLKQTNKNNKELQDSYNQLATNLANTRAKLNKDFKDGLIDEEVYRSSLRELDSFSADLGDKLDDVQHKLSTFGNIEYLADGINYWVQAVGQSLNSVLSSLSEITDNYYASEIEKQQEYIDQLQDMYDLQEEITRQHADALSAIEDELSTARGDRRQQLIDQLNAEMAAQRASLAQQKKIEAQKKKEDDKQKQLEIDQARAKKRMQEAQAYINMAMSISMAAVNSWPIPAIPMMALAAATGAAQIAAIKSQNIPSYGKGGLIEGKSHKQGGVKATLGLQPIELEGNEYIIRKKTTIENLGLLDFVNKSERKLKLEDFIEFYSSNKVRKSVASANPRNKFESGGQVGVPILRTDIDINNRLLNAFEDYSNRPTVVEVKEILDKTEAVKQVRVLAGLAD